MFTNPNMHYSDDLSCRLCKVEIKAKNPVGYCCRNIYINMCFVLTLAFTRKIWIDNLFNHDNIAIALHDKITLPWMNNRSMDTAWHANVWLNVDFVIHSGKTW